MDYESKRRYTVSLWDVSDSVKGKMGGNCHIKYKLWDVLGFNTADLRTYLCQLTETIRTYVSRI